MIRSPHLLALAAIAGAALVVTSTATAQAPCNNCFRSESPTVVGGDGSSYVDVSVKWDPLLIARRGSGDTMRVTLTGRGRAGRPMRFDRTIVRYAGHATQTVRLNVRTRQRGAFAKAKSVVVSTTHHWDSPADPDTNANLVAVSNANVTGTVTRGQFAMKAVRDCDVSTLGPTAQATGCDFSGADLAGADLSHANLAGSVLDNANLSGTNLSSANLTGTSMVGANIAGANFGTTSQAAFTMPQAADPTQGTSPVCQQTGGGPMCEAIYSAKSTIGAVYYQFAGPNVTRWLQDAIRRGVNVFVIENSANTTAGSNSKNPLCQTVSATDPQCAWSPKADPFYALEAQLKSVGGPGTVRVQFSSQNFNITHQKSILVDVLDPSGNALNPGQIAAAGGSAIVSSGNLQAYPNYWGQRTATPAGATAAAVINPQYLTDPAAGCAFAPDKTCDAEWTPRDFAMRVTDASILARIAGVYASDLACAPPSATNVQHTQGGQFFPGLIPDPNDAEPISAKWPETWSNGSVYGASDTLPPNGQQVGDFPFPGLYPNGYFAYGDYTKKTATYLPGTLTGNVRARQLDLIRSATKTLVVYNEEMSDWVKPAKGQTLVDVTQPAIVNALIQAAQKGVKVSIVMANGFTTTSPSVPSRTGTSWYAQFDALLNPAYYTKAGAVMPTIQLLDSQGSLYIHAKAIVADGVDGWFGSINASSGSMNTNRELGLGFTSRSDGSTPYIPATYSPQMIAAVTSAAASDGAAGTSWSKATGPNPPYSSYNGSAQFPCINTQANADSGLPARDPAAVAVPPQAAG